jgi:hypothetical protein
MPPIASIAILEDFSVASLSLVSCELTIFIEITEPITINGIEAIVNKLNFQLITKPKIADETNVVMA